MTFDKPGRSIAKISGGEIVRTRIDIARAHCDPCNWYGQPFSTDGVDSKQNVSAMAEDDLKEHLQSEEHKAGGTL